MNDQHKIKKRSSGGGTRDHNKDNALFASFLNNSSSDDSNDEQEEVVEESIESIETKELDKFKKEKGVHLFVNATNADKEVRYENNVRSREIGTCEQHEILRHRFSSSRSRLRTVDLRSVVVRRSRSPIGKPAAGN